MCAFIPDCNQQVQRCILIWGNGVIDNSGEQWDDGNHYNFDGCSTDCQVEKGFVCTDGSSTTVTNWLENQFMPKGSLQVLANNDLIIRFNDTITIVDPNKDDLYIVIYGPLTSYEFTWTAKFQDESTLLVNMDISSEITGKGETIYVEFLYTNRLTSTVFDVVQSPPFV